MTANTAANIPSPNADSATNASSLSAGIEALMEVSPYARLKELARRAPNDLLRAVIEEVADDVRFRSLADLEMEAYLDGSISRQDLAKRLEELADGNATFLQFLKTNARYGVAWHDDEVGFLEGGV